MSYLVLARKYRPQNFSDLTGQEVTAQILQSAIMQDRIAPAYLFSGPRGIGKTTTARILAKALNCHKAKSKEHRAKNDEKNLSKNTTQSSMQSTTDSTGSPQVHNSKSIEPCNECSSCQEIASGRSIDVLEIDAASHTQVDNIREVIINTVAFASARDRYKIFIIDEVHMLSNHSFNALLKTLEEPPPHVVFILATTEYYKIPDTISSRCQRFRFLPLTHKQILSNLQKIKQSEKIPISDEALSLVAGSASGSMRDALSLLDQVISHLPHALDPAGKSKGISTQESSASVLKDPSPAGKSDSSVIDLKKVEEVLGLVRGDLLIQFIGKISEKDSKGALYCISDLLKDGYDLNHFLKEIRECFREMLILKCGYVDQDSEIRIRGKLPVNRFSLQQLLRDTQLLTKCSEQMRWNDFPRTVLECYAVQLCQEFIDVTELLKRLDQLNPEKTSNQTPSSLPSPGSRLSGYESPYSGSRTAPAVTSQQTSTDRNLSAVVNHTDNSEKKEDQIIISSRENISAIWNLISAEVQQLKPSLGQILGEVSIQWVNGTMELSLPSLFQMERIKMNLTFLEKLIEEKLQQKVTLVLKLKESEVKLESVQEEKDPSVMISQMEDTADGIVSEEDTIVLEDSSGNKQQIAGQEIYEVIDDSMTPAKDLAVEDEGMKSFLEVFSGKITKIYKDPKESPNQRPMDF